MLVHVCKMYYARTRVGNYYVLQARGALPWPCYIFDLDPCDLRCAMMRMRVCKMYYAGARVGNYCVFAGFGRPPMAMLHFGPVDPCDLRCLCTYVKYIMQGLG